VVLQETLRILSPSIMTLCLQRTFHNILTFHPSESYPPIKGAFSIQKPYGAHNEEFPSFDNKMTTKNNIKPTCMFH
jgi:hypothetical protein